MVSSVLGLLIIHSITWYKFSVKVYFPLWTTAKKPGGY